MDEAIIKCTKSPDGSWTVTCPDGGQIVGVHSAEQAVTLAQVELAKWRVTHHPGRGGK